MNIHWKDWCWSWSSSTLAPWCKALTHWKRPWCWERLKAREEGDDRGWDGWLASLIQWTWVWTNSGKRWRTGKFGMLQSMGSQRVRHDWATEQEQQEKNLIVFIETQQSWERKIELWLQTILQSFRNQTQWYWLKNRNKDQWNTIESLEINPHTCVHYDKRFNNIQWGNDSP